MPLKTSSALKGPQSSRVVVIGSGPSGLAAATRLVEAGFENVLILEAENRIGGRVYTVPFGDNVVDLGAQWCHGEKDNVVYEALKRLNRSSNSGKNLLTLPNLSPSMARTFSKGNRGFSICSEFSFRTPKRPLQSKPY
uniref:Amine oxidase domain-containing protein n=1 Tax=Glossina austeni TaxID=7395 RepID=A0A1A9VQL6_GLOAU